MSYCGLCGYTFESKGSYEQHLESNHIIPGFCTLCLFDKCGKHGFLSIKCRNKKHRCITCSRIFLKETFAAKHMASCNVTVFACSVCSATFNKSTHYIRHSSKCQTFTCTFCEKIFYKRSLYYRHLSSHSSQRPFKCHICNQSYKQKSHLTSHISRQHLIPKHTCQYCPKRFSKFDQLSQHHLKEHQAIYPSFSQCVACGLSFQSEKDFKTHLALKKSSFKNSFTCTQCCKQFKLFTSLKQHMRQHTTIKHECLICNRSYSYAKSLAHHVLKFHKQSDFTPSIVCSQNQSISDTITATTCLADTLISNGFQKSHVLSQSWTFLQNDESEINYIQVKTPISIINIMFIEDGVPPNPNKMVTPANTVWFLINLAPYSFENTIQQPHMYTTLAWIIKTIIFPAETSALFDTSYHYRNFNDTETCNLENIKHLLCSTHTWDILK